MFVSVAAAPTNKQTCCLCSSLNREYNRTSGQDNEPHSLCVSRANKQSVGYLAAPTNRNIHNVSVSLSIENTIDIVSMCLYRCFACFCLLLFTFACFCLLLLAFACFCLLLLAFACFCFCLLFS